jgi:glutathione S-transferase
MSKSRKPGGLSKGSSDTGFNRSRIISAAAFPTQYFQGDPNMYMNYVYLVILLALFQFLYFTLRTGLTREKMGVEAPSTVGNETWERIFRVQQNTMEQLIMFIPAILLFSHFVSPKWALLPGVLFIIGRQIFSHLYVTNPPKRAPGVALSMLSTLVLLVGSLIGILIELF